MADSVVCVFRSFANGRFWTIKIDEAAVVRDRVRRSGLSEAKSHAGRRTTPLPTQLASHLEPLLRDAESGQLVFGQAESRPFSGSPVLQRGYRAWNAAGLQPVTLHECRHAFASYVLSAGLDPRTLQTLMGNSSITVTMDRYVHLIPNAG